MPLRTGPARRDQGCRLARLQVAGHLRLTAVLTDHGNVGHQIRLGTEALTTYPQVPELLVPHHLKLAVAWFGGQHLVNHQATHARLHVDRGANLDGFADADVVDDGLLGVAMSFFLPSPSCPGRDRVAGISPAQVVEPLAPPC